jgi:hypothetical protein
MDHFLLLCKDRDTYDDMVSAFRKRWTVPALNQVKMFFGIRFIISDHCVMLDQTHMIKEIVAEVFGPNHDLQSGSKGYSTPMIAGTEHAMILRHVLHTLHWNWQLPQNKHLVSLIVISSGDVCIAHYGQDSTFSQHASFLRNINQLRAVCISVL